MRELLDSFGCTEFEAILRSLDEAGSVLAQSQADMDETAASDVRKKDLRSSIASHA